MPRREQTGHTVGSHSGSTFPCNTDASRTPACCMKVWALTFEFADLLAPRGGGDKRETLSAVWFCPSLTAGSELPGRWRGRLPAACTRAPPGEPRRRRRAGGSRERCPPIKTHRETQSKFVPQFIILRKNKHQEPTFPLLTMGTHNQSCL